jgi:hypothetical protein
LNSDGIDTVGCFAVRSQPSSSRTFNGSIDVTPFVLVRLVPLASPEIEWTVWIRPGLQYPRLMNLNTTNNGFRRHVFNFGQALSPCR